MSCLQGTDHDTAALLVDIGNTRLKWCLSVPSDAHASSTHQMGGVQTPLSAVQSVASDVWSTPQAGGLFTAMQEALLGARSMGTLGATASKVTEMRVSCVGPQAWRARLEAFAAEQHLRLRWAVSTASQGPLSNGYADPAGLGVDRFLSALAVVHSFSGRCAVIVSAGTATTVDAVDASGRFLGGYILPGADLMASSLHRNTALLPQVSPQWVAIPVNTEQAIASGIVQAQSGAVHGMLSALHQITGQVPMLVLSGGARVWLQSMFPQAVICDHLVLQGLALWQEHAPGVAG